MLLLDIYCTSLGLESSPVLCAFRPLGQTDLTWNHLCVMCGRGYTPFSNWFPTGQLAHLPSQGPLCMWETGFMCPHDYDTKVVIPPAYSTAVHPGLVFLQVHYIHITNYALHQEFFPVH